jgi:ABC-type nitrate/sulfonate/bicarbonate transport system substrate-binding protein
LLGLTRGIGEPLTDTPDVPRVLGSPFVFGTFALSDAWVTQHPDAARKVTEALDEAIGLLAADPGLGPKVMATVVRDPEKPFVSRYPPSSYLSSKDLKPEALAKALKLANASVSAAEVTAP